MFSTMMNSFFGDDVMKVLLPALALPFVILAGCASATASGDASGSASGARPAVPPAKVTGADQNCVLIQNIRETRVRDDKTIDFYMRGGKVFRNTLPNSCPQLGFERAFSYSTSISQLCNVDIITVFINSGGIRRGASCGLGKFTPIEKPAY
jgi:hypothetical protein